MDDIRLRIHDGRTYVLDVLNWKKEIPRTGESVVIDDAGIEKKYIIREVAWCFDKGYLKPLFGTEVVLYVELKK